MHASRPAPSSPCARAVPSDRVTVREAQWLLMPLVAAVLMALLLAWPSVVRAQGASGAPAVASPSGTHTVRPGETLWSLAVRYYGDGHQWRELASFNGLLVGDERGIVVGQVLRVPSQGASPAAAVDVARTVPPVTVDVSPADAPTMGGVPRTGAPTGGGAPADLLPRIGIVRPSEVAAARGADNATIFLGPAPIDVDTMSGTIWLRGDESFVAPASRRVGEFQAAPIAMTGAHWKAAGRVKARALDANGPATGERQRMQLRDLVEVVLPPEVSSVPGIQLVTVALGAELGRGVRLAVPTGVLTLETPRNGVPVARVTRVFGMMEQGQSIVPHVEAPDAPVVGPVSEAEATVRWITDAPLLPSLQSYLLLVPADGAMLEPGDRFALLSTAVGASKVAEVRVVRVTPHGATAIVTQQIEPTIRVGMRARRIGRAP
jgi:hypothetical protein